MIKRKKYLSLFIIIIILLIFTLIITNKEDDSLSEETAERTSDDYKITEDMVILNVFNEEGFQVESVQEDDLSKEVNLKINTLTLFSPDFLNLESIPSQFTCDGDNINPNLEIAGIVEDAKSLVLIMEDIDAPDGIWDHWIKFNIPVDTRIINEAELVQGISGKGTGGSLDYSGPCPPEGKHQYVFKLYSLDVELILPEGSSKEEVETAMEGHILQEAELIGVYERTISL